MGAIYKNYTTTSGDELDRLFNKSFKDCAEFISQMDTLKKAEVAANIQPILLSLYDMVDKYGNPDYPRDEQIGPDVFIFIMSKIKRWETILYWLYEIDIMMEETSLDTLIHEAEERIAATTDPDATRIRVKDVQLEIGLTVKKRVTVSVREDLNTLLAERASRGNHTEEIMSMAKSLANKYFK